MSNRSKPSAGNLRITGTDEQNNDVQHDMTLFDPESEDDLSELFSEVTNIPFFTEEVEHGYSLEFTTKKLGTGSEQCPRCRSETKQKFAYFPYTITDGPPRIMLASAGYFCTECPSVVIDEDILRKGGTNSRYQQVIGLEHDTKGTKYLPFNTWNDQELVYIGDTDGLITGFITKTQLDAHTEIDSETHEQPPTQPGLSRTEQKRRRKIQKAKKEQRKKNRKRK